MLKLIMNHISLSGVTTHIKLIMCVFHKRIKRLYFFSIDWKVSKLKCDISKTSDTIGKQFSAFIKDIISPNPSRPPSSIWMYKYSWRCVDNEDGMHDMTLRNSSVEMIFRRRAIRLDSGHEQCFQEFFS